MRLLYSIAAVPDVYLGYNGSLFTICLELKGIGGMTGDLTPFFSPKGVAIIGASTNPGKLSYGIVKNMTLDGYQGGIYPINPKADQILGLPCYPDIREAPDPVDLAVIVLPAPMTPAVLQACGERGIKAVVIISGGFREVGESGIALEAQCKAIAKRYQMRVVGPNCVGTLDLYTGLNTTFIEGVPDKGGIGFISQSGAVCGGVVDYIADKHIGFSHFASLGNLMDVDESDMIAFFGEHPKVKVIACYVEGIPDGEKFMRIASKVARKKPILMLKAGRSDEGARAVSSHTGSLAGAYPAYQTAFRQSGVIEVPDLPSLFDVAWAFNCQPLPRGNRAVLFTNAGGPAALASDSLAAHHFSLSSIRKEKQVQLAEKLNPSAQVANPIDMLGGAEPADFAHAMGTLLDEPEIDVLLPILVPQALVSPVDVARAIVAQAHQTDKTVLTCMVGERSVQEAREVLHKNSVPMSIFPETPGKALGAMAQYRDWLQKERGQAFNFDDVDKSFVENALHDAETNTLGEAEARPILKVYGMNLVEGDLAADANQAAAIAERIGFPVVLKIVSPHILHKSDLGGISLNLGSVNEVKTEVQLMEERIRRAAPTAEIKGYLVEKMAPKGMEVIVGMRRDPTFGPVMMFGLGGVNVELFKDVSFAIAPLTSDFAEEMITGTRAGRLLAGYRGGPIYDVKSVVEVIGRLSQLALDHPSIQEVEINPLLVQPDGGGAVVLDARMILSERQGKSQ
jgi:acetyl coenzyme A synthetase (ADP forming)-like protein